MQTFVPDPSFQESLQMLDKKRLGKQRLEAWQILGNLKKDRTVGWGRHVIMYMWRGFEPALEHYYNLCLEEFSRRGCKNIKLKPIEITQPIIMPPWVGDPRIHLSHQSQILGKIQNQPKMIEWYKQWNWSVEPYALKYVWPDALRMIRENKFIYRTSEDKTWITLDA
jgi:hypothetical protein